MRRGLFSMKEVAAAGLRRNDAAAHARQVKDDYIAGMQGASSGGLSQPYARGSGELRPKKLVAVTRPE
jgi:hypothetical protein